MRVDPYLGTRVHVVGSRQSRPNLPATGCPFCVGGLEAPEPYQVRWFPNRWPAMPDGRCEMILFSPDHDASLGSLGAAQVRRVIDLWAERSAALGARDDVATVLVFENRGREVGATIDHPHGQIYAYPHVPDRPARRIAAGWRPEPPGDRTIVEHAGWRAWVPYAPTFPVEIALAPERRIAHLADLGDSDRTGLAEILGGVLSALDRLYDEPLPYMMWFNQAPFATADGAGAVAGADSAWLNIEIVSPRRAPGVSRFIASAEVACQEYFLPVAPEAIAERLRPLIRMPSDDGGSTIPPASG